MNVELGMARTSRRLRDAAQDPRNSPNGFKPSKRSQTALTIIKIGTPSSKPKTPQSQPQASNPTNTATGLSWLLRLVSQGVSKLPTSVWIPRETPQMTRAMSRAPTCKKSDQSRCGCRGLQRDFLAAQTRSGRLEQLASKAVAGNDQELGQEQHGWRLTQQGQQTNRA